MVSKERKCADCGAWIWDKVTEDSLTILGVDGKPHQCYTRKPIGREVEGRVVESLRLRDRRLFLEFDGGVVLEVRGAQMGTRIRPVLKLSLMGLPGGVIEE